MNIPVQVILYVFLSISVGLVTKDTIALVTPNSC